MEVTALVITNVWLNIKDDFEVIEIYFRLFFCGTWLNLCVHRHPVNRKQSRKLAMLPA